MDQTARAFVELDLTALRHNVETLRRLLPPGCALMPAVKADAYGHGAALIAPELERLGVRDFCVATAGEGVALRRAGVQGQILVLGYTHPSEFEALVRHELTQTALDCDYAERLSRYGHGIQVHVGVDTGMRRLGERSENIERIARIFSLPGLRVTGIFSHLSAADGESPRERAHSALQLRRFYAVLRELAARGIRPKAHIQSSAGILRYPQLRFDYARPGLALYGAVEGVGLLPVLSLKARVGCVRQLHPGESAGYGMDYTAHSERRIAAIAIGYADGVPRALSGRGYLLVRGRRAPILGRVCMDQLTVDVTGCDVRPGEAAVLIGRSGEERITAPQLATLAGTIPNEILSGLSPRLGRVCI